MDKLLIVYTMKGCPHCIVMKESLDKLGIEYHVRDIDEHKEEYDLFVEATENEFVPAFMIIEDFKSSTPNSFLYTERDYQEVEQGVQIVKEHFNIK